jgi:hypothetical protein
MDTPQQFDWVTVRNSCSVVEVFKRLRLDVEEDVERFNDVRQLGYQTGFRVVGNTSGNVFVVCGSVSPMPEVKFSLGADRIEIDDHVSLKKFHVTLTLNKVGRCMFRYDGEELEPWQLRRMALEALLFSS